MTNPGLSIGASGVGLPWHNHEAAWEAVVHGRKLFLLLPPMLARPGPPVEELYLPPTLAFIRGHLAAWPGVWHVLLEAGDVLWIPCNWWHATLNIGETVAVGGQHEGRPGEPPVCEHDLFNDAQLRLSHAATLVARHPAEAAALLGQAASVLEYHVQVRKTPCRPRS